MKKAPKLEQIMLCSGVTVQTIKTARQWIRIWRLRSGATLFEYAVILFFVSVVAVLILKAIGGTTNNMLGPVNNGFQQ